MRNPPHIFLFDFFKKHGTFDFKTRIYYVRRTLLIITVLTATY